MHKRPTSLVILALLPGLAGLLFPALILALHPMPDSYWDALNLPMITFTAIAALGLGPFVLAAQRWALLLLPVSVTAVGGLSLQYIDPGLPPEQWSIYWGAVGAASGAVLIADLRIVQLILEPSLRWWQRPKRHSYATPVSLTTVSGAACPTESVNLSESGILVRLRQPHNAGAFENGQIVTVEWTWQNEKVFLPGAIARRTIVSKNGVAVDLGINFLAHPEVLKDLVHHLSTTNQPAFSEQQNQA